MGRAKALRRITPSNLREFIMECPEALLNVPVYQVLLACPGIGAVTVKDVLGRAGVWPFIPLGELTIGEKTIILELLPTKIR